MKVSCCDDDVLKLYGLTSMPRNMTSDSEFVDEVGGDTEPVN